jgi:multimeric flavodoxin WrbA
MCCDAVVFATPVYFSDLSESLRSFLDRFRRVAWQNKNARAMTGKKAYGICVAGGGGGGSEECAIILTKVLATCRFEVCDIFPVRRQNLEEKIIMLRNLGKKLSR